MTFGTYLLTSVQLQYKYKHIIHIALNKIPVSILLSVSYMLRINQQVDGAFRIVECIWRQNLHIFPKCKRFLGDLFNAKFLFPFRSWCFCKRNCNKIVLRANGNRLQDNRRMNTATASESFCTLRVELLDSASLFDEFMWMYLCDSLYFFQFFLLTSMWVY